jgi:hypothetical protein
VSQLDCDTFFCDRHRLKVALSLAYIMHKDAWVIAELYCIRELDHMAVMLGRKNFRN